MRRVGFWVDPKSWEMIPDSRFEDNPPDSWEECGCCGCWHPADYDGDCRSDINRWPSEECVAALTGRAA